MMSFGIILRLKMCYRGKMHYRALFLSVRNISLTVYFRYDINDGGEGGKGRPIDDLLAKATPPSAFQSQQTGHFIPIFKYPIKLQNYEANLQDLNYARIMGRTNLSGELARLLNDKKDMDVEVVENILYDPIYENISKNRLNEKDRTPEIQEVDIIVNNTQEVIHQEKFQQLPTQHTSTCDSDKDQPEDSSTSDLEDWLDSVL